MKPKDVLVKWIEAFNNADVETIADFYDDNAVNHQVANAPVQGKQAIKEMFRNEFKAAKMVCIVENIFEDGNWAILEWRDPLGLRGCGFFQIVGDKIVLQRGYWDKLSFLKQHNLPLEF
jgi:limonene-1,2-epoxide hydrolase